MILRLHRPVRVIRGLAATALVLGLLLFSCAGGEPVRKRPPRISYQPRIKPEPSHIKGKTGTPSASLRSPEDKAQQQDATHTKKKGPFYLWPLFALIHHHREVTTKMDGPRCPLYPTCSAWAEDIIRQKGLLGVMYFIDRLFYREFGPLHEHYLPVPAYRSRRLRYFDPISDSFEPREGGTGPSLLRDDF